ncbi:hypothetical protein [Accumulibacter sp.]|nr:hypothetical protein [Accumulibacter sp.]
MLEIVGLWRLLPTTCRLALKKVVGTPHVRHEVTRVESPSPGNS